MVSFRISLMFNVLNTLPSALVISVSSFARYFLDFLNSVGFLCRWYMCVCHIKENSSSVVLGNCLFIGTWKTWAVEKLNYWYNFRPLFYMSLEMLNFSSYFYFYYFWIWKFSHYSCLNFSWRRKEWCHVCYEMSLIYKSIPNMFASINYFLSKQIGLEY